IGVRPGEKIHEEMITSSDSFSTYDLGKYYVILPQVPVWKIIDFVEHFKPVKVVEGFNYSSGTNSEWLSINELRNLIREQVDSNFGE
ncbi:MAG: polysaccharide biosynthesis protein, partial [Chitinophagaceae bacterium]